MRAVLSKSWLAPCALGALIPFWSSSAAGQQVSAIEEVTVTARRREENLQEVPISIATLNAEDFERRGIADLERVSNFTAGLDFEDLSTTFNGVLTIRGLTQADVQNRVQNVAVFLDGVFIPRNYSIDMGIADFERVEVVKGPQSALYGQNAFAGALNYVTRKPSNELEAGISTTVGTDGRFDYKASIGGPIVPDKVAARAFFASTEFDGNRDNSFPTVNSELAKTGGFDREAWGVSLAIDPTEDLDLDVLYYEVERHEQIRPGYTVSGNRRQISHNCGPAVPTTGNPSFYCGELPDSADSFQTALSTRPSGDLFPNQPGSDTRSEIIRASLGYDFSQDFSLDYVFGRVDAEGQEIAAITDDPTAGFFTTQKEGGINDFKSHEVRLVYEPDGPFSGELGFYSAEQTDYFVFSLGFAVGNPAYELVDTTTGITDTTGFPIPLRNFVVNETTDAIFGRLSYDFLDDRATLSAEFRQSSVDVSFFDRVANLVPQANSFDNFTPRITAEYRVTEDSLAYVSAAKGIKAGGFNGFVAGPVTLLPAEQTYDEEENWTLEIGTKNTLMDGRLLVNAAAYFVDWKQMQITAIPSNFDTGNLQPGTVAPTIFLNVGDVTSWGIEVDGSFLITDQFSLNYAFSTSDPQFENGTKWGQFVGVCDDVFCPADGEVGGNTLPRQTRTQFAIGGQYETTIRDSLDFFARADLTYQSKRYVDALNLAYSPERYNLSASVGLQGERWSVTAWGKNLTDETYVTSSLFIIQFRRYGPAVNDGRTAGVTFAFDF